VTILNLHVTRDRVLMCMDTETKSVDGARTVYTSKIFYLPHANLAMGCRGPQRLMLDLYAMSWSEGHPGTDHIEEWLLATLMAASMHRRR